MSIHARPHMKGSGPMWRKGEGIFRNFGRAIAPRDQGLKGGGGGGGGPGAPGP